MNILYRIDNLENELKTKRDALTTVKYENDVLTNIQKNQNKAKQQFEVKYENKNEVRQIQEKLKTLKEEYKYSKDLLKSTDNKIKTQNSAMAQLEEKNQKIKENIEHKKRQTNNNNNNNNNVLSVNTQPDVEPDQETIFQEKVRFLEIQNANEERNYKNEVQRQSNMISKLNDEINMINIQSNDKEQEIRINELKLKELRKINRNPITSQNKNNGKSPIRQERAVSANENKIIRKRNHESMSKTPNHYTNKPFKINKFDTNNNTNTTNIHQVRTNYDSPAPGKNQSMLYDQHESEPNKEDMLSQIENLSNIIFIT